MGGQPNHSADRARPGAAALGASTGTPAVRVAVQPLPHPSGPTVGVTLVAPRGVRDFVRRDATAPFAAFAPLFAPLRQQAGLALRFLGDEAALLISNEPSLRTPAAFRQPSRWSLLPAADAAHHAGHQRGGRRVVQPLAVEALPGPEVEREGDERVRVRAVEARGEARRRARRASGPPTAPATRRAPAPSPARRARAAASARSRGTSRRARSAPRAGARPGPRARTRARRSGCGCSVSQWAVQAGSSACRSGKWL